MKRHPFLADLVRHPWAIVESYVPLVAGVITRLACGEQLTAADREAIDAKRATWDEAHGEIEVVDGMYARVAGAGFSGTVAVVGMYGVLSQRGGIDDTSTPMTSMSRLAAAVSQAAADPAVAGIVLDVDSPGGTVQGTSELADAIYGARAAKPIAAVCNSLMASAAYWTASQAGEVYAAPGSEVGSIGVYTVHTNVADAMKQKGISVEMISAGKFKTETNPYGPLSDEARAHIQASVDSYYDAFVRAVARGRGASLKAVREGMGQGRLLQPDQAKSEGMIDGVATLGEVVAKLGARAKRASARAQIQRDTDIASAS